MEAGLDWSVVFAALLLGFALSTTVAWVYATTYQGVSYVRGFAQTLSLAGIVSTVAMLAVGDDVARGLGLVGALALVRFRSTLKDTRDLVYAFAALGVGAACGVLAFTAAVGGTVVFCVAAFWLSQSPFGSRRRFDGVLRLSVSPDGLEGRGLEEVLARHCRHFALLHLREVSGGREERAYQVKLRDAGSRGALVRDLGGLRELGGVSLLMQDMDLEV